MSKTWFSGELTVRGGVKNLNKKVLGKFSRSKATGGVPQIPEVPKRPRKTLMVILLVAIVGVTSVGAFIWWSGQKGEEAPPTSSPLFNTYSKYGFTFEYPKGMSITEKGMLESTATNSSGMVLGELKNGKSEEIMAGWISTVTAPDLEAGMEGGFTGMKNTGATVDKGQIVYSTKSGHTMIYQYFNATVEGETWYGISSGWYCDTNDRFYMLLTMSSEQDVLPKFQQYLGSFICH